MLVVVKDGDSETHQQWASPELERVQQVCFSMRRPFEVETFMVRANKSRFYEASLRMEHGKDQLRKCQPFKVETFMLRVCKSNTYGTSPSVVQTRGASTSLLISNIMGAVRECEITN